MRLAFDFPLSETSFDFNDELKIGSSCFARTGWRPVEIIRVDSSSQRRRCFE
ncbi:expressed protein [Echinococcus multilocularis]|uniref:Expressed protein n=1 Tax=Echinococcus multilocularis TaxID=6211 RepID=A0A087W1I0_ECHMU|nr:expressed protein [Echinococcus multilocularis]